MELGYIVTLVCAVEEDCEREEGDSDGDDEGDEEESTGDDMQLAWENLEVARHIYTDHQSTHTKELAGGPPRLPLTHSLPLTHTHAQTPPHFNTSLPDNLQNT
jgi:hypothetical protein